MAWGGVRRIKDATALPSDVAQGKIFYNNGGRQIGTNLTSTIPTKFMMLQPSDAKYEEKKIWNYSGYWFNYIDGGTFFFENGKDPNGHYSEYNQTYENIHSVIALQINDWPIQYLPSFGAPDPSLNYEDDWGGHWEWYTLWGEWKQGIYTREWLTHDVRNARIYVGRIPKDKQIGIYYIEKGR